MTAVHKLSPIQADTASTPRQRWGDLEVRLARNTADVEAAQALRYRVFYEEMQAVPTAAMRRMRRDFDLMDQYCDHLLVIDHSRAGSELGEVVGTYRLIRREMAEQNGSFYSAAEYNIDALIDYPGEVLELGRSCIDAKYRNANTMFLLWRGIADYINKHQIQLMFGCASFPGTDPEKLKLMLSYLYHFHLAPPALRTVAVPSRYVDMRLVDRQDIDIKQALADMPPLIKGYLRVGGFVGDGAVIDSQWGSVDVCVIVKSELIAKKYARHYELTVRAPPFAHALDG